MTRTPIPGCCLELMRQSILLEAGDGYRYRAPPRFWTVTVWLCPDRRWPKAWRLAGHRPGKVGRLQAHFRFRHQAVAYRGYVAREIERGGLVPVEALSELP
jgi:hypothetical protein